MRARLLGVAAATWIVAGAACSGGVGDGPRAAGLDELRICAEDSFDSSTGECLQDERAQALVSRLVYCSAEFVERMGERFSAQLRYEGELVTSGDGTVDLESGALHIRAGTSDDRDLPAGRWKCSLAIGGESLAATFRTGGDVEAAPIAQGACLTRSAGIGECPASAVADSFERPSAVNCSSRIVGAAGRAVQISVLRGENDVVARSTEMSPANVHDAYAVVDPTLLEIDADVLPEGGYACRFAVGDDPSWDVPFTVEG